MRTALVALALCAVALGDAHAQDGRAVFEGKGNCFACHGKDAKGTPLAPNLTDDAWINVDGSLAAIRQLIARGVAKPVKHPAPMPPMGGAKLSDKEIDAVAAYVFELSKKADGRADGRD